MAPEWADRAVEHAPPGQQAKVVKAGEDRMFVSRLNAEINGHEADIAAEDKTVREAEREL